jgi:hypothetical protein
MSDDAAEREARMAVSAAVLACMAAEGREATEAALDAHREAMHVYARAVRASMPCYLTWDTAEDDAAGCEAGIAALIEDEKRLGIAYVDRDRRCPSCEAKAEQQEAR